MYCPVGWSCRIYQLLFCRGVRVSWGPAYDSKQFNGEVSVMLELWGMQITPSLSSLPGPLRLRVVVPDRVLSMCQIELNYVLIYCGIESFKIISSFSKDKMIYWKWIHSTINTNSKYMLIDAVTAGNSPDDNSRKHRWQLERQWTGGKTATRSMVDQHSIMYIS